MPAISGSMCVLWVDLCWVLHKWAAPLVASLTPSDGGMMFMTLAYAIALAEGRSCLAALADTAPDIYESSQLERLLIELDGLHPYGPALSPTIGTRAELLDRLEVAIDQMIALGEADGLSLELLLMSALDRE